MPMPMPLTLAPRRNGPAALWTACLLSTATAPLHAKIVEEVLKVPVKVENAWGKGWTQDIVVTVFTEDKMAKPYPVLVLNHGRATDAQGRQALGRARYSANAAWLARLGFMVVVPTRVGYGESGGEDVEDSGSCERRSYPPVYAAAADQTLQVLTEIRKRPDAAPDRTVLMGQSFGGATSVALAARNPAGVQAIVNFAGGGGGDPDKHPEQPCSPWALSKLFADYGKTARVPMLWAYSENDRFWGPRLPKTWFDTFKDNGGQAEFAPFPPVGQNGHSLFTAAPELWRPRVLSFLQAHGYPDLKAPLAAPSAVSAPGPALVNQGE
jgi:dienelactone hydrolase